MRFNWNRIPNILSLDLQARDPGVLDTYVQTWTSGVDCRSSPCGDGGISYLGKHARGIFSQVP